jgi:hypothetical protein
MYSTIDEIKAANRAAGDTWFGPEETAFFGTEIVTGVLGGWWFVTRDDAPGSPYPGSYTVRAVDRDGHVRTVGEFQGHASREDAIMAIRDMTAMSGQWIDLSAP